jgi:hypothetical protein
LIYPDGRGKRSIKAGEKLDEVDSKTTEKINELEEDKKEDFVKKIPLTAILS